MYNNSARKEIVAKRANDYSEFGKSLTPVDNDPVDCCLPGSFLDCPKVADLGMCPAFMAQRCAANWDEKCTTYANSLNDDIKLRDFMRDTAGSKYCQLSPDSNCTTMCQPFDPIAQDSPKVCKTVGSEVLKDANASIDIGWYYPVNISPDYMGSCRQTCNKMNPRDIKEDDPVINTCLKYGYCNDILTNVCQLADNSGVTVNHPGLSTYCKNLRKPAASSTKESLTYKAPLPRRREKFSSQSGNFGWALMLFVAIALLYWAYNRKGKSRRY